MNFNKVKSPDLIFNSIFFKALTRFFVSTLFLTSFFSFSQQKEKYTSVEVKKSIENIELLIRENRQESYFSGIDKLNSLEKELVEWNNSDILCDFYIQASSVFLTRYDLSNAIRYTNKGLKVAIRSKNHKKIGFFYENLGVIYNYYEQKDKRDNAFYMSKEYLTKYNSLAEQGDMYYNMSYICFDRKDWDKSLTYALKSDSITRFVKNEVTGASLLLGIAECYLKLGKLDKAKEYLNLTSASKDFTPKKIKILHRYYKAYGELLLNEGNNIEATKMFRLSNDYNTQINKQNIRLINENLGIQNRMQLAVFNYEKLKKEADFKSQNLKYQKYILILASIIILSLGLLLFLQIRITKYKSRVNTILKEKNNELKHALSVKRRFLNSVSHELRTPLNAIKSVAYLMHDKKIANNEDNVSILNSSIDYLLNLSNQILEYNLIDKRKSLSFLKKDIIDLKELFKEVISSVKNIHHLNENKVFIKLGESVSSTLIFDKTKLTMVFNSFLDNAFKFTKNGEIRAEIKLLEDTETSQKIKFIIQDTGFGIEKENISKIFDLFYQGSEEINIKYGGSGIGLSIAKQILDLHPNQLNVTSELNKGTTISFELDFEKANIQEVENEILSPNVIKKDIEILLVEDNKINQLMIQKILLANEFNSDIAENGQEAIDKVVNKDYDLIIMDIMMPIMDGFEASKKISELKPYIPIVALTALSEEYNREKFRASKIKKVLNKPIDVDELFKTINQFVNT